MSSEISKMRDGGMHRRGFRPLIREIVKFTIHKRISLDFLNFCVLIIIRLIISNILRSNKYIEFQEPLALKSILWQYTAFGQRVDTVWVEGGDSKNVMWLLGKGFKLVTLTLKFKGGKR